MNWKKININKFQEINKLVKSDIKDDEKLFKLIELVFDVENTADLPLKDYNRYVEQLDFLKTDVKPGILHNKYKIGDYECRIMTVDYTVAQYSDYMNFLQQDNQDFVNLISCVLIPVNHEYNEGYDIEDFKRQLGDNMSIVDAVSISFFFKKLYLKTIKLMLKSLDKEMKKSQKK